MSYIAKLNQNDDNYLKKGLFRKPLKNRISDYFKDDLALGSLNPFSQQLTPWNGSSKLEASINLLRKQVQSKQLVKHSSLQRAEPSVERIVAPDTIDYPNLIFHSSNERLKQPKSRYACPRLKVSSQQVIALKNSKDETRRFLFNKKPPSQNKNIKKIASLTIQWDEDIVYNPQKKYFEEQNMKKKILREFSHTRNQNRNDNFKKQLKSDDKLFKLEFKNNKIHRKEVSIFEFRKKDLSVQLDRSKGKQDKSQLATPYLSALLDSKVNNQANQIKVSNLSFEPETNINNFEQKQGLNNTQKNKTFQSDKWKFRTSIKAKRTISPQKSVLRKGLKLEEKQRHKPFNEQAHLKSQKQTFNRITLELHQNIKDEQFTPFEVLSKTSPHFFKKTVD